MEEVQPTPAPPPTQAPAQTPQTPPATTAQPPEQPKTKRQIWKERMEAKESKEAPPAQPETPIVPATPTPTPLEQPKTKPEDNKIADLVKQNADLTKELEGIKGDSVAEQYKQAELNAKREAIVAEQTKVISAHIDAIESDFKKQEFCDSYNYYIPKLKQDNPTLVNEIMVQAGENYPLFLQLFFGALNEGLQKYDEWATMPPPVVKARVRKVIQTANDAISKAEQTAPATPPPTTQAPAQQPLSIVPRQTPAAPATTPNGTHGSYLQKLIADKLKSRGR